MISEEAMDELIDEAMKDTEEEGLEPSPFDIQDIHHGATAYELADYLGELVKAIEADNAFMINLMKRLKD